jgi:hypothetical protein
MPHMNRPIRTTIAATAVLHEAWYQSDVAAFLMELGPAVCTQVCSWQKLPLDRSGANVGNVPRDVDHASAAVDQLEPVHCGRVNGRFCREPAKRTSLRR